ncbi:MULTISPECIES: hypothetical protein [Deefgea]|uniref:Uncharacterized protein n=1 Tax=Deefgea chitinilytica TaxID=570276 RepID=A0ABS2C7L6_9NEIS|nr:MULTISPECIES: hypothetical protein [Deefgea]MBM5570151.1 hypothetical protein [Deefgea chitinilytica]MBM9887380.1 hypothetical protein [Deefgea sp. CFH1-16]
MPISPELFASLIEKIQSLEPLAAYQGAEQLDKMKHEMTDEQRLHYDTVLGDASRKRKEIAKAQADAEAVQDAWDQDEN